MWGIVIAIILFIVGVPGLLDDLEVWRYDWMTDAQLTCPEERYHNLC